MNNYSLSKKLSVAWEVQNERSLGELEMGQSTVAAQWVLLVLRLFHKVRIIMSPVIYGPIIVRP